MKRKQIRKLLNSKFTFDIKTISPNSATNNITFKEQKTVTFKTWSTAKFFADMNGYPFE